MLDSPYFFHNSTQLAVLIDPEKDHDDRRSMLCEYISNGYADLVLIGGSTNDVLKTDYIISEVKRKADCPVVLFPGSRFQLSALADALFLPSLISSFSAEYIINKHVEAAREIKALDIPVIPVGYMLIGDRANSATSFVTSSHPINPIQEDKIVRLALAGEHLGMKAIYLEAGSGSQTVIGNSLISAVKQEISVPLIVGGGINTLNKFESVLSSAPSMIVLGNVLEKDPDFIISARELQRSIDKKHEERYHHKIHR